MNIIYRPGRIEDCSSLAEFVDTASDGVVEFLFHDLIPDQTPVQIVALNLSEDRDHHTFRDAIVAQSEQKVIGMSLSYPSHFHRISNGMRNFLPPDRLKHVENIFNSGVQNSLYLDTLCVDQEFRGKGVGSKLISLTRKKAGDHGIDTLSLIVLADNTDAQKLYKRLGFETVCHIEMDSHELIPHEGGAFLMACRCNEFALES
jgi:ribosomal protein S18 acetylase RimI-like enzyme